MPSDEELVDQLTAGDELAALARAEVLAKEPETLGALIYSSTEVALSRWARRVAATPDWAGASIPRTSSPQGSSRPP